MGAGSPMSGTARLVLTNCSEAAPVSYYTAALEEVPACRLLCYLYENSIGPEQLRDVLSDFCGRTL